MRIGLVCPYSFDVPGGVQLHVRDLASYLLRQGHHVSVLAPADEQTPLPAYVHSAGRAIAVPYNGSVARLAFGPLTSARVRRWLAEGEFDLVHLHEPLVPSLSLLALLAATEPLVATFHTSISRSRAMQVVSPLMRPAMEKLLARIAVSEDARRTVVDHLGGDAVVVPNGVDVAAFADAVPDARWVGQPGRPSVVFLGRLDEPRKGLSVLAAAWPEIVREVPGARLLVAGAGDVAAARERFAGLAQLGVRTESCGSHDGKAGAAGSTEPVIRSESCIDGGGAVPAEDAADSDAGWAEIRATGGVEVIGQVSEEEKRALLASADVFCAPQTGGESFGIVLVEAMSSGAAVVASDLPAFARVLDDGAAGQLFRAGEPDELARAVLRVLGDDELRGRQLAAARATVGRYDWSRVAQQVETVYSVALAQAGYSVAPRPGASAEWAVADDDPR